MFIGDKGRSLVLSALYIQSLPRCFAACLLKFISIDVFVWMDYLLFEGLHKNFYSVDAFSFEMVMMNTIRCSSWILEWARRCSSLVFFLWEKIWFGRC